MIRDSACSLSTCIKTKSGDVAVGLEQQVPEIVAVAVEPLGRFRDRIPSGMILTVALDLWGAAGTLGYPLGNRRPPLNPKK